MMEAHLETTSIYSIVSAIVWLMIGVMIMRYANQITIGKSKYEKSIGKPLSFYGLMMFVNAAISVYLPKLTLAWSCAVMIAIVSGIAIWLYDKRKK